MAGMERQTLLASDVQSKPTSCAVFVIASNGVQQVRQDTRIRMRVDRMVVEATLTLSWTKQDKPQYLDNSVWSESGAAVLVVRIHRRNGKPQSWWCNGRLDPSHRRGAYCLIAA